MRRSPVVALLAFAVWAASLPAAAHGLYFRFRAPAGAGNHPDGGVAAIAWDDLDTDGFAWTSLYAVKDGVNLIAIPTPGAPSMVPLSSARLPTRELPDAISWDVRGVRPGCYQPYAFVEDPGYEVVYATGPGLITVSGPDNVHPSVWIDNPPGDGPAANGRFALKLTAQDPDDGMTVSAYAVDESNVTLPLGSLPALPAGTHAVTLEVDTAGLAPGTYQLMADVRSSDGARCASFWKALLTLRPGDGEEPAPTGPRRVPHDAGWLDAAEPVAPSCGALPGSAVPLAALLWAAARRRRR